MTKLEQKHCKPCEGGTPPLTQAEEDTFLKDIEWEIDRSDIHKIRKRFTLKDFREAMGFVNRVAERAEKEQHHPDIHISCRKVTIELCTHAVLGLTENDFILAAKIEKLACVNDEA